MNLYFVIDSVAFLNGKYPTRHSIANIHIKGPRKIASLIPRFLDPSLPNNKIKELKSEFSGENLVLALDDNRLNSLFTFMFQAGYIDKISGLIDQEDQKENGSVKKIDQKIKNYFLKFEDVLLNEEGVKQFILLVADKFTIENNVIDFKIGDSFYKKMMIGVFGSEENPEIIKPTNIQPDKRYKKVAPTTTEIIGAPVKYWAEKRNHISAHIRQLQKLTKGIRKNLKSFKSPDINYRYLLKLENEKRLLQTKFKNLRITIGKYLLNLTAAMIYIFQPSIFALERLDFDDSNKRGYLSVISSQMFSNVWDFLSRIIYWLRGSDSNFYINSKSVYPMGTSKYSFELQKLKGVKGKDFNTVDRYSNADYSYIIYPPVKNEEGLQMASGKIINAHENADFNIAYRGVKRQKNDNEKNAEKVQT